MKLPFTEIAASLLLIASATSLEGGGIVGAITASAGSGTRVTGAWTSYTPTRFGVTNVEFFANGTCQFRMGGDETISCTWQATENGRTTIKAVVSGKIETYFAAVTGDTMVVKEPGRETPYVRVDSKEAYERQRLARGPA